MEFITPLRVYFRGNVITDMKFRPTNFRKTEHLAIFTQTWAGPPVNTLCTENESVISMIPGVTQNKYILWSEKKPLSLGSQHYEAGQKSKTTGRLPDFLFSPVLSSWKGLSTLGIVRCSSTSKDEAGLRKLEGVFTSANY